jgi:phosphoglucosamine mutase
VKLFGTDGLRGRAGEFPFDERSLDLTGREVGRRAAAVPGKATVVIGGDTRESTSGIVDGLSRGIAASGGTIAHAGVVPTPAVAELVLALSAAAGISVSASHNPFEDNGIKIFGPDGKKWSDEDEASLEEKLIASQASPPIPRSPAPPPPRPVDESLAETYVARLLRSAPRSLEGLHIVLDSGNGAAHRVGPETLRRAGARVTPIFDRPDGRNINAGCGALHPQAMAEATRELNAQLGTALDGDADRAILSDETGRILDGDDVLWIVASAWKRSGALPAGGVVGTVMSNWGLEAAFAREGIAFARAAVGDRAVARLMEERGAGLGGETSGHILLPSSPAGDGLRTTLTAAAIVAASGRRLSELATLVKTPQQLRNVRVARRVPVESVPDLARAVTRAESRLADRGRVYLRYSGTEPLLRILVEGFEATVVGSIADELEAAARAALA